ncbi:hypothetical protein MES5069_550243 [Mesorhizobium escarrei]|uniref:Uncharacterized protein n=1 Tax=Mesorhizobium escarrei TaxID=666018 RepID=A0ABM9ED93_9HYPH|nr:hypothetical protein MES5069_550243 [Mesorhizobium escarrei]
MKVFGRDPCPGTPRLPPTKAPPTDRIHVALLSDKLLIAAEGRFSIVIAAIIVISIAWLWFG